MHSARTTALRILKLLTGPASASISRLNLSSTFSGLSAARDKEGLERVDVIACALG